MIVQSPKAGGSKEKGEGSKKGYSVNNYFSLLTRLPRMIVHLLIVIISYLTEVPAVSDVPKSPHPCNKHHLSYHLATALTAKIPHLVSLRQYKQNNRFTTHITNINTALRLIVQKFLTRFQIIRAPYIRIQHIYQGAQVYLR
jgi:hypothetical protein